MHRRKQWSDSGVSEVIGTILILAMTVTLFSVIIVWVASFPTPAGTTRLDMNGHLVGIYDQSGDWTGANITIEHRGGESLSGPDTQIVMSRDRSGQIKTLVLKTKGTDAGLTYGLNGPDADWDTGEVWSYTNYSLFPTDIITMSVIDKARSVLAWSQPIQAPAGSNPPIFTEKWADRYVDTPSIDQPVTGQTFSVLARVQDPDGDLNKNSVYVYFAFLYGTGFAKPPVKMYDDGTHGDKIASDSVFTAAGTWYTWFNPSTVLLWDGGIILFNATDTASPKHALTSRMTLSVGQGPPSSGGSQFGGTWNGTLGGIGQGDSGPEGDYGYNIYNKNGLPTQENPGGTPTRIFIQGETVYVIARSTVIKNLENINTFILRDYQGYKLFPPTKEYDSRDLPNKHDPAFTQMQTSPWFEYQYSFSSSSLAYGQYPLEFTLKDNAGHAAFYATDAISITASGVPGLYPKIATYQWTDGNANGQLDANELTPATRFASTDKMFIRIFFKDKDTDTITCSPWSPPLATNSCPRYLNANAGTFELHDYFSGTQLKKTPGTSPVSKVSTYAFDQGQERTYVAYIDLLHHDQDPWVPGTNYYTLRVQTISDSGIGGTTAESYQSLSTQVVVIAPMSVIDVIEATQQGGGGDPRGVYWYENQFYWNENVIDLLPKDAKKPTALATGDLDGNTKIDVVVATDSDKIANIAAYYNLDYGTTWRRDFINQIAKDGKYKAQSLAMGDLDGDGNAEIVAGVKDSGGGIVVGVTIFWNDGNWTTQVLRYSEGGAHPDVNAIAIGDVNHDGRPDIVSGDNNGVVDWFCNNVRGSWLPPKTKPCPGQSSLQPEGATWWDGNAWKHRDRESISTGVKVGKDQPIGSNELALGNMEGKSCDLDPTNSAADRTMDIVVTDNDKIRIYTTALSPNPSSCTDIPSSSPSPSWTAHSLPFGTGTDRYGGDKLDGNLQSITLGDMNNDKMLDIIIGIDPGARKSGVYRFRNMGMSGSSFTQMVSALLPHTTINPKDNQIADLKKVNQIAAGDLDGDGDLDIIYLSDEEHDFLNNLWMLENRDDNNAGTTGYVESNVFTDNWRLRKEKGFAIALGYIDL